MAVTNANPESLPTGIKRERERKVWGLSRILRGQGMRAIAMCHLL